MNIEESFKFSKATGYHNAINSNKELNKGENNRCGINPCSVFLYRGLNHHGSLISQCFDNVQREHRPTLIQQSERRFHGDKNTCPSNPSTEIQNKHNIKWILEAYMPALFN